MSYCWKVVNQLYLPSSLLWPNRDFAFWSATASAIHIQCNYWAFSHWISLHRATLTLSVCGCFHSAILYSIKAKERPLRPVSAMSSPHFSRSLCVNSVLEWTGVSVLRCACLKPFSIFLQSALCWSGGRWTRWSWRRRRSTSCAMCTEIPPPPCDGAGRRVSFPGAGEDDGRDRRPIRIKFGDIRLLKCWQIDWIRDEVPPDMNMYWIRGFDPERREQLLLSLCLSFNQTIQIHEMETAEDSLVARDLLWPIRLYPHHFYT